MAESLYTTGGTVQAQEGGLYLVRPADQQLLELCRQSRFAYVLTPRQLGKSSLMIRTAEELQAEGFRAVMVDLTQIGTHSNAETWYGDVLEVVADQLELTTNARTWWKQEAETGLTLRLTRFFEEVVLAEVSEPIVIFVDEIDTTLSLGFTDDFFAAIRYFYVARAQNPALRRLSFVLIGVATPADLIRDPKRTPFNIGERVDLRDFTPAEAAPLAAGLPLPPEQAQRALGWILGWTGGHPYLSQRLCSVLAADPPAEWSEAAVNQAVGRNFFGERSEQDNNLQFVRDMLTKRAPQGYGAELLRTYRSIWQGKQPVADEEQNLVHSHLKLAGVVRRDGRQLVVRNRLYREVFNTAWIEEHNPEDFWKRYGPVLKWAVPVSVSALLVAGVMAALALEARRQSIEARRQTDRAEAAQRRALMQEDRATRQARRALQAEARAKTSETKALAREKDTQRALQQLSQSQRQERQALTTAEQQRQRAEQEAVTARQQRGRAEQQTLITRAQTALASLRAQVAQALNLLPTSERASGLVLAMDAWARSQSEPAAWGASAAALLQAWLGAQEMNLLQNGKHVTAMAYSPDSKIIAGGSEDGRVRLWDAKRGVVLHEALVGYKNVILSLAFSPDGKLIAGGGRDGKIRVWDAKSGAPIGSSIGEHALDGNRHDLNGVFSVKFSPNGRTIASGGGDGTIRLWNTKNGAALGLPLKGHQGGVLSLAYSPNGRTIASVGKDGTLRLWDAKSGAALSPPLMAQEGFHPIMLPKFVNSVAFDPEGRTIITGANNGRVRLWDAVKQVPIGKSLLSYGGSIKSIAFSPDGRRFASGSADGTIRLWDVYWARDRAESTLELDGTVMFDDSVVFRVIRGHDFPVTSVAFSPDGSSLASGSDDQTIRIWELPISHEFVPNGAREPSAELIPPLPSIVKNFKDEGGFQFVKVLSISYSLNGRRIISISQDGQLRFWDSVSGAAIGAPLIVPEIVGEAVAFSPDGRLLAGGSRDRTVRLWDAKSGAPIGAPLKGHEDWVRSVAFSPDGRLLASGSDDRTVQRWVASPKDWFRLACTRMARHPLLVNPASATSDTELIAASKRASQSCQAANRSAERAQHQGSSQGLAGLLAWARRLLP